MHSASACFARERVGMLIALFIQGSTPNLFIWNDMNEVSMFSRP